MKKFVAVLFAVVMLMVTVPVVAQPTDPACGTFCEDGSGGGGSTCFDCLPVVVAGQASNEVDCWALITGYGTVPGRASCVEHNVPVGPGYCEMSGASCTGLYASTKLWEPSYDFRSKAIADFMRKWPGVTDDELTAIANTVHLSTIGKSAHDAARIQYAAYRDFALRHGVQFAYGNVPVYGSPRAKAPTTVTASIKP